MKKACIIVAVALSLSFVLSACGGSTPSDAPPAQTSGTKELASDTTQQTSGKNIAERRGYPDYFDNISV